MRVCVQLYPRDPAEGDAVHLVQSAGCISGTVAAAKIRVQPDLLKHFQTNAATEALEQVFVQQGSPDQGGVEGRDITEVVVVGVKLHAVVGLEAYGQEVAPNARSRRARFLVANGAVCL